MGKKGALWFLLDLVCVLLLTGCGKEKAGEYDFTSYSKYDFHTIETEGVEAFAIRENGEILLSNQEGKLAKYDSSGQLITVSIPSAFYGNLCYDGDTLYAYDYQQSAIVELSGDEPRIVENSIQFHTIRNMVALDGKLYVLGIPFTQENHEKFFAFGRQEFEDCGEIVYCVDTESGQYSTLDLEHITAEYRTEDGKLYFYGWQEEKYYLYEYDTEKYQITERLHQESMCSLLSMVVEGGYLFGMTSTGLVAIELDTGKRENLGESLYSMFGNDLQFSKGNLFLYDMVSQSVLQAAFIEQDGQLLLLDREEKTGTNNGDSAENTEVTRNEENSKPTASPFPQRTETITLSLPWANNILATPDIRKISGMKSKLLISPVDNNALLAEMMAGNDEVDIYLNATSSALTQSYKEIGFYTPLNSSEVITSYLDSCFDYIKEAATLENGDIWMVPLYAYMTATWYVPENMELFGLKEENLNIVGNYLDTLEQLQGKLGSYNYYNYASRFISYCDQQYDFIYNDYETGEIDFRTGVYRDMMERLWNGWEQYAGLTEHPLFHSVYEDYPAGSDIPLNNYEFDRSRVIFKTVELSEHIRRGYADAELLEGWRVMGAPGIQEESEQHSLIVFYLLVNPYSEQKEAAIAYLEAILSSLESTVMKPVFFQKDIEAYAGRYDITQPAFLDLYRLSQTAGIFYNYSMDQSSSYIQEYQQGKISLDQAIERRQKKAEMSLYE